MSVSRLVSCLSFFARGPALPISSSLLHSTRPLSTSSSSSSSSTRLHSSSSRSSVITSRCSAPHDSSISSPSISVHARLFSSTSTSTSPSSTSSFTAPLPLYSAAQRSSFETRSARHRTTSAADYFTAHALSLSDPELFWGTAADELVWYNTSGPVLQRVADRPHSSRWFPNRQLNLCFNCLDVHVEQGRGEQVALIYDSPVTGTVERWSYSALHSAVNALSCAYASLGLKRGDVVLLYLPMVPQSLIAILACARLGLVQSTVFGGFAASELAKRITDCSPRLIVTASCGLEAKRIIPYLPIVDQAATLSGHQPDHIVVLQRPQHKAELEISKKHVDYQTLVDRFKGKSIDCVAVKSTDVLQIMYTSGTTGQSFICRCFSVFFF